MSSPLIVRWGIKDGRRLRNWRQSATTKPQQLSTVAKEVFGVSLVSSKLFLISTLEFFSLGNTFAIYLTSCFQLISSSAYLFIIIFTKCLSAHHLISAVVVFMKAAAKGFSPWGFLLFVFLGRQYLDYFSLVYLVTGFPSIFQLSSIVRWLKLTAFHEDLPDHSHPHIFVYSSHSLTVLLRATKLGKDEYFRVASKGRRDWDMTTTFRERQSG